MTEIIPARPEMARALRLQAAQILSGQTFTEEDLASFIGAGLALAVVKDGEVLALGGIVEKWPGYATIWGLLSGSIGATFPLLHRGVCRALVSSPWARIEAHVAVEHEAGHRWMGMLGFQKEGVMRKFWQGRDFALYARVKD